MNTANHITPDDLALFALQFLPEDELRAAIEHMEHCESCREEVARLQGDLVAYAMTADVHSPPAQARERLLRRIAKERRPVPIDRDLHSEPVLASRNSLLFPADALDEAAPRHGFGFLTWAGWAVAAGIAVVAGMQFHQRQLLQSTLNSESAKLTQTQSDAVRAQQALDTLTDAGALQVVLHLPAPATATPVPPKPEGHAAYLAEKGALVFVASNLDPLQSYKTYELWLLPANGHDPIPAGLFKPDANGNASVVLPDLPKGVQATGFGVTIEDDGGSKSTPTKPIVLVGM
jgi:anti-sigma-K factor RskA